MIDVGNGFTGKRLVLRQAEVFIRAGDINQVVGNQR